MLDENRTVVSKLCFIIKRITQGELFVLTLGSLITIITWLLASFLTTHLPNASEEGKIWVEACRDISAFTLSITIFDSLKDFILRQENENEKVALLSETTTRFEKIMDARTNISENGIIGVQDSFNIRSIKEIILKLEPEDCLYCHDGFISDISLVKQAIISKALIGVRFQFMALAPYCMNAIRRAQEVNKEGDIYSNHCKEL